MKMLQCPKCKFKNVWKQSIDHHIFYSNDELHKEEREKLKAKGWSLDYKYNERFEREHDTELHK